MAFFKSGWGGTHNIKAGYQLNHLSNVINQHGNVPFAFMYRWRGASYGASTIGRALPAAARQLRRTLD